MLKQEQLLINKLLIHHNLIFIYVHKQHCKNFFFPKHFNFVFLLVWEHRVQLFIRFFMMKLVLRVMKFNN